MTGPDAVLWLMIAWCACLLVAGFWMKFDLNRLDRKIAQLDAEAAARRTAHPAE